MLALYVSLHMGSRTDPMATSAFISCLHLERASILDSQPRRTAMHRDVSQRLMTIEEAMHLSALSSDPRSKFERPSIWAWQTVARAMAQTVSHEQIAAMTRKSSRT
jgi:hypothetical protein